ncbi:MAG TPA: SIS domain-containing protein [Candidatus Pullichristensenella excrementigallinarum]|uniref:SIS domain-containing protein n=1 Tax=Candidatus Pullichristensenella excrementigallinarum TaxID=2840907 RepID=A0A9D1LBD2_9FIRM|nr:SIS domain-containing protein [Candidatus Pullichristensenella excrementigallinarum]
MSEKYSIGNEIKSSVEKMVRDFQSKGGLRTVYLVACGGSLFELNPLEYLLKCEAKGVFCASITANEFFYAPPVRADRSALVIAMSLSGNTPEVVSAAEKARELGATVVTITGKENCALAGNADFHFVFSNEAAGGEIDYERSNMAIALRIGFELLHQIEGYAHYEKAVKGFEVLNRSLQGVRKKVQRRARVFGEAHKDDAFIYTVGSGPSYGLAKALSVCIFMEMEWIHSSVIHSGEMFHGPFECVNFDMPFVLFMSEGKTRYLDERARNFVERQSGRVTLIDARELGVSILAPEVEEYFSGLYTWIAAMEYAKEIAFAKRHPLFERRYMGKEAY